MIRKTRLLGLAVCSTVLATGLPAAEAQSRNGFDLSGALVPAEQIHWGGVRRDEIASLDTPQFDAATENGFLRDKDRVLGVYRNGVAKAYPVRILERHEVVNDQFGDERIVVTYCPLCFSGMSFLVQSESTARTFGVSGLLYNSDLLLYDRQTGSLWSQIRSQAIAGPLKGTRIQSVATAHTSWRDWQRRYPDTLVLAVPAGSRIDYRDSVYATYKSSGRLMMPVANRSRAYRNKEPVLGLTIGDAYKAYPFKELRKNGEPSLADTLAGQDFIVEWQADDEYARVVTADGKEIPSVIVYWFAWYAFHPQTEVFQAGSG